MREAKLQAALSYREPAKSFACAQGLTNKEIADRLGLTVGTIKHYVAQLFKKMNVRNRLEAMQLAQKYELMWPRALLAP
jgi:DNA-binding NarL/FixJ family response regulator